MDSETDADTLSLCDSEISRENYKSPESSDCEGYATPLASSLTDISSINHGITINAPEDDEETPLDSGERTPVSTHRAISPPVVKQIIYLQKPKILVMTQREILDESSEEEFFDVDDVQIRDVAQQLLDGVSDAEAVEEMENDDVIDNCEERPDTPLLDEESEDTGMDVESVISDGERLTPMQTNEVGEDGLESQEAERATSLIDNLVEIKSVEADGINTVSADDDITQENKMETTETMTQVAKAEIDEQPAEGTEKELETLNVVSAQQNDAKLEVTVLEPAFLLETEETLQATLLNSDAEIESHHDAPTDITGDDAPLVSAKPCDNITDSSVDGTANVVIAECVHDCQTLEVPEKVDVEVIVAEDSAGLSLEEQQTSNVNEAVAIEDDANITIAEKLVAHEETTTPVIEMGHPKEQDVEAEIFGAVVQDIVVSEAEASIEMDASNMEVNTTPNLITDRPDVLYELLPADFSEIVLAKTPLPDIISQSEETEVNEQPQLVSNQETVDNDPMPTLVISDEVKTPPTTDNDFYNRSTHKVKVDFDGYSSGKEESLSSSTSSESFEFAEPVSTNHIQDERTQALRNSIIERYPSNETDEDELDDVGDDFDDDLLAVKQISAEVEQLVAAINAFGRDEEQQMSAYLVGKKMAAEKKRKSVMATSPSHDQTVQTNNDSFILVDRRMPIEMESLQVEIDKLQADLEAVKNGEKELLKINSKLKEELEESQQTIDGIEVEAEQQYTELTSEIDELCEIVQKKDQDLALLKEKVANLSVSESNLRDDVDSQRVIVQRQKEIIESLREDLDAVTKKLGDVTKLRDKAIEEVTVYKIKNQERDKFLSREAQMSMEIEDLQRELNKQRLILNHTSVAKLADTFDRRVLHLENELRERDMLICKQNQIINNHRKSPTGSVSTTRKMQPRTSVLAASGNMPSAGSSSESFQHGLDTEAKDALVSFILSDRHQQLANIYNIGRILDLNPQEERAMERHLTKDRFT